jgi:hypothetical protein
MKSGSIVATFCNYEGGLLGLSGSTPEEFISDKGNLHQEFAFVASQAALSCCTTKGNLLAVAGTEEIVKMFNLRTKKSCGELAG